MNIENRLQALLERRKAAGNWRSLQHKEHLIDFCSNDYLSLARLPCEKKLTETTYKAGSTGSRLLSGHYPLLEELEGLLQDFHRAEAALVLNSGYSANLSLLSAVPRRSDVILYDALIHASMHDGLRLSAALAIAFPHNDLAALAALLQAHQGQTIFVLVESIYSMDGDEAPLLGLADLCQYYQANLIVDEAHSTGCYGTYGEGLCCALGIEQQVFARIHTFGKAVGAYGASILGSATLRDFLINYARPFIYTTAPSPHSVQRVLWAYQQLQQQGEQWVKELQARIQCFRTHLPSSKQALPSQSPIQSILVPGNDAVVACSLDLEQQGFDVRPIRRPTVAAGSERLRICLHRHNSLAAIKKLLQALD
ncbi:MAG: aminotransferase class I/II-fold pyridoxal phosphate-dependent enzyme [Aureispira sp.]